MGSNIAGNDISDEGSASKLKFEAYSTDQLLEQLIMLQTSLDIDKTILSKISSDNPLLGPSNPGLYLIAIIRKFATLHKEGSRFGILGFSRKNRGKQFLDVMTKFESNLGSATKEKTKNDSLFIKGPGGAYIPMDPGPTRLKKFVTAMQPVYVVGGSIYTFNANGGGLTSSAGELSQESQNRFAKDER